MTTKAKAAKTTLIKRGDGAASETFTLIAEIVSFSGPKEGIGTAEATSFDSAAEEFVATMPMGGEITLEMIFVGSNAQQQGLRTDMMAGTLRNFQIVFNDHATTPTTLALSAIVTSLEKSGESKGIYKQSCTLKVSGLPTVSQYAAS